MPADWAVPRKPSFVDGFVTDGVVSAIAAGADGRYVHAAEVKFGDFSSMYAAGWYRLGAPGQVDWDPRAYSLQIAEHAHDENPSHTVCIAVAAAGNGGVLFAAHGIGTQVWDDPAPTNDPCTSALWGLGLDDGRDPTCMAPVGDGTVVAVGLTDGRVELCEGLFAQAEGELPDVVVLREGGAPGGHDNAVTRVTTCAWVQKGPVLALAAAPGGCIVHAGPGRADGGGDGGGSTVVCSDTRGRTLRASVHGASGKLVALAVARGHVLAAYEDTTVWAEPLPRAEAGAAEHDGSRSGAAPAPVPEGGAPLARKVFELPPRLRSINQLQAIAWSEAHGMLCVGTRNGNVLLVPALPSTAADGEDGGLALGLESIVCVQPEGLPVGAKCDVEAMALLPGGAQLAVAFERDNYRQNSAIIVLSLGTPPWSRATHALYPRPFRLAVWTLVLALRRETLRAASAQAGGVLRLGLVDPVTQAALLDLICAHLAASLVDDVDDRDHGHDGLGIKCSPCRLPPPAAATSA